MGHGGHASAASWAMAVRATLHCLTGCAVGEILGMTIGTARLWGNVPTMVLAIALAFVFGYSLTLFAVMGLVDNAVVALTPGAMEAQLSDGLFWYALLGGFAVAFVITTPVNK
ncbi:hypothetical protein DIZ27_05875 [Streptomyces sp. NWU339]|uniref:DUF4396 domain-containing protein n=1 Tax=Streptomyces sp. NWU339 TaxID=2185284 RepID=UPI000D67D8AA|nr:DUF4396 domain-containing protein [Streptomyces sp. NWU339]PWI11689.1 hypothetical protein DIZ27_05875 [Streptomyces sp. NWU339]